MSGQLRIILIILILLTFALFISQVKQKKLKLQYTLTWLALLTVLLIIIVFPQILSLLTQLMGIQLPINLVFFLGFILTLVIIYRLTVAVSKQSEHIKDLTQKVALMEKEINERK